MSGPVEARLAAAVQGLVERKGAASPAVRGAEARSGVVTAVGAGGTVDVGPIRARRLDSYRNPTVGDQVVLVQGGSGSWWAAGRVATAADTAWTDYTPVWEAVTTNPSLGNGTLSGRWMRVGRTVHFNLELVTGTLTTFGSGSWRFSVPVAKAADGIITAVPCRISRGGAYIAMGELAPSDTFVRFIAVSGTTGAAPTVSSTAPTAWSNNDRLRLSGTYEAAS